MSRPRPASVIVFLFVASAAGIFVLVRGCGQTGTGYEANPAVPSVPSSALLEGLRAGDAIDEWTVARILVNESVQKKPQLAIELERKGSGMTIWITRKDGAVNPPLTTTKYALSYGHARPYGEPIPEDAPVKVMNLIAERVKRTESTVEPPAGL